MRERRVRIPPKHDAVGGFDEVPHARMEGFPPCSPPSARLTSSALGLSPGLAFIVFALISAMVIPRSNPDIPGRRLGWFVSVTVLFFVGMMCAVFFFGKEAEEPAGSEAAIFAASGSG